ncbi:MAG TPA: SH3 domain-containing protein [Steroidobacteraceae bacterium]|nr:SH3 domain-containing protein [Steroidobacteraceae bacterium]
MRMLALPALLLVALAAHGQTVYVTDKVQAVVYAQPSLEGNQVRILESGDAVELVSREGDNAHIRLDDGSEGWIAGSYLVVDIPATRQLQALTAENERLRASARTDSAASGELKALKDRNAQLQADLAAAQRDLDAVPAKSAAPAAARPDDEIPVETLRPANRSRLFSILALVAGAAAALAIGFWWGYSTLERRVRRKYGGLKVY